MALLTFSSRLPPPNILPAMVSLKSKLPRGNASQLGSPARSSFASISFLYFLGQSTTQGSISKCCAGAAWQPPKYVYPDPNPEFARKETQEFQVELMQRLSKNKDTFGNDIDEVVSVCTEIFSNFLHKEYGGPGTLLIEPFTDMLLALKEKKLPGAPIAARAALLWAQNYVDRDWESWSS